jgi:hypothetical protein
VSLPEEVALVLRRHRIAHAVIGAAALAVHGISRATADLDLLVVDASCLDPSLWRALVERGVAVEIRRGDESDPLAGVIRVARHGEGAVDVIVGRHAWQRELLGRSVPKAVGSVELPVVRPSDLVLLKLFAGGPQDAWDIHRLLDLESGIAAEVEPSLPGLPEDCARLWRHLLAERAAAP